MTRLALEINDAGLALAGDDAGVVSEHPGIALIEAGGILTGEVALRKNRLYPLGVQNDYWRNLGVEPLPRTGAQPLSAADVAFAQLTQILEPHRAEASGLLLAVPAGYSREQLGLLLGIAAETGVPLLGLADSALLAVSTGPVAPRAVHLDLQLHQTVLSVLEAEGGGLRRGRFELLPRQGWLALQQSWVQLVATAFVRRTRFDPLHQAATEQVLTDRLPGWLAQLVSGEESVTAEITFGDVEHAVELTRVEFVAAAQSHYSEWIRLVQAARPAGTGLALYLSHRFAMLPGFSERLAELRDLELQLLERGAAALGALLHEPVITRPRDALTLVYRLPAVNLREDIPAAVRAEAATPHEARPTHILFGDRAWAISEQPLTLGWSVQSGRALPLPQAAPGVSRSHCTVRRRNGSVIVEDHSTYGSFVNEERVVGHAVLTVGDRLRLGTPGVTLELIQLVNDDGAPQD